MKHWRIKRNGDIIRYKPSRGLRKMWMKHHIEIKYKHLLFPSSGCLLKRKTSAKFIKQLWDSRF